MDKLFITNEALAAKPATIAKLAYKLIFQAVSSIDGRALNAVQEHPYSPPVSAMVAFSKVVKNNTALAVVHVEGNKMYDATKPSDVASFKKLVLSGGNHSFKVVMRPTLKGGTPTPTDFDAVGEALMGGTSQCMAFYKGMRYPVILDKEYALQVIKLGEEQLVNGLHLGVSLAEQAADYADQLRIIKSAIVRQYISGRDIEAAAASIESTEEEMTRYFFMNLYHR